MSALYLAGWITFWLRGLVVLVLGAACVLAWRRTRNPIYLVFLLACAFTLAATLSGCVLGTTWRVLGDGLAEPRLPEAVVLQCEALWILRTLASLCIALGSVWFLIGRRRPGTPEPAQEGLALTPTCVCRPR